MQKSIRNTVVCGILVYLMQLQLAVRADQLLSVPCTLPVHLAASVNELGCNNSPGPQITLEGQITLGALDADLIFKNNVKGTHTTVVTWETTLTLVSANTIVIPKQPVLGGVGGNPYIWMQFLDDSGAALTGEIYLGRCVQGLAVSEDFDDPALASIDVSATGCSNNPGPTITFSGSVTPSGLTCRFIFRNNLKGTHTAVATADVTVLPSGNTIQIPKQPVLGGSGGNPWIWLQLLEDDGTLIGDPLFLGRCVQM